MLGDILKLIITGNEHSGTTICLECFKLSSQLDSGWECGILTPKGRSPHEWKDFASDTFYANNIFMRSWKLSQCDFEQCMNSDSLEGFYRTALKLCPLIRNKNVYLIDKTPRYVYFLDKLLIGTDNIPIIVMRKDPKNQIASLLKRGIDYIRAKNNYRNTYFKYFDLIEKINRIQLIHFEYFIDNPTKHIEKTFNMMNLKYVPEDFSTVDDLINTKFKYDYKGVLTSEQVLDVNKEFERFVCV